MLLVASKERQNHTFFSVIGCKFTGVGSGGYAGDLTLPTIYVGDIDIPSDYSDGLLYPTRTEMLGKAICQHRIQENPSAAGAPPRTPANPLAGGRG